MGTNLPLTGPGGDTTVEAATDTVGGEVYPYAKIVGAAVGSTADVIGGLTEAAPGTDTASSGLNGRLQRIAQRLTSILAVLDVGASALLKSEDAPHASGDAGVLLLAVRRDSPTPAAADGDYVALSVSSGGRVFANVDGDINSVSTVEEAFVHGFALHGDAADSMPVLGGHEARTTNPTAVDNGDTVRSMADDVGRQVVVPFGVRDLVAHQHTQIASSSSETTIATAGGAGVYHDLISLILTNQTATAVNVTIKDSTGGTTRMVIALAASGGAVLMFPAPVASSATNANWTATLSSAAVTVNIFAQFVKNV